MLPTVVTKSQSPPKDGEPEISSDAAKSPPEILERSCKNSSQSYFLDQL